jgi:hypothetical protein
MNKNDAYMTISHYHNNPEIIVMKKMFLMENIQCIIYTLGDGIEHILLEDDVTTHKEQMRLLNLL